MKPATTRRNFLKTTGAALSLAAVGPQLFAAGKKSPAPPAKRTIQKVIMWNTVGLKGSVAEKMKAIKDASFNGVEMMSHMDHEEVLKDEAGIATDKEVTDRLSALMLKLLVILNTRPQFVEEGRCVRPQKLKHGRVKHCELWSPNLIGRYYRTLRDERGGGTHASPRVHWRRGFVRNQPYGPHRSMRKPVWIQPVLVGLQAGPGAEKGERL